MSSGIEPGKGDGGHEETTTGHRARDTAASYQTPPPCVALMVVLRYFLRLGTVGFGGPIAVVGYMQRDLVEVTATTGKAPIYLIVGAGLLMIALDARPPGGCLAAHRTVPAMA